MVGRAYAKQAAEYAPAEYKAARTALNDARAAMQDSDYGDARDSLDFSLQHARRAVVLAEEAQARRLKEEKEQVRIEEEARLKALEERKQKAQSVEKKKPTPQPKKVVKSKMKVVQASDYTVGWPLLYQANRDQIKDPRQIFPGQSLSIRRDMTETELEDARQRARESDIFPVPPSTETEQ
jgi:nucleoid-associated protein YgaU